MEIIYRAANSVEAHLVQGMLQQQEIVSYVNGELLQSGVGEIPMANFINVMVDNDDAEQARAIIADYDPSIKEVNKTPGFMFDNGFYIIFILGVFFTAIFFLLS